MSVAPGPQRLVPSWILCWELPVRSGQKSECRGTAARGPGEGEGDGGAQGEVRDASVASGVLCVSGGIPVLRRTSWLVSVTSLGVRDLSRYLPPAWLRGAGSGCLGFCLCPPTLTDLLFCLPPWPLITETVTDRPSAGCRAATGLPQS